MVEAVRINIRNICGWPLAGLLAAGLVPALALAEGAWHLVDDGFGEPRHEGAFVQAGESFYVLGGREADTVRIFDPLAGEWRTGATSPIKLHHFQAVELHGLILVIGAMTGNCCSEPSAPNVYLYDPLADRWTTGPSIPTERLRGGGGAIAYDNQVYWISGNENGHAGPVSALVDRYDPATGTFSPLPEIPHPRDHFFATLYGDRIYVIGGRESGGDGGAFEPTIREIDVYDIADNAWQTLPLIADFDPPRAAAAAALLNDEIILAGGESFAQESAHAETQAFDPNTETWRELAAMRTPRHATQAIVANGGFYVAGGSPWRGGPGGLVLDTEAWFPATPTTPDGQLITSGNIDAPELVSISSASTTIVLGHQGGNQAVILREIDLAGNPAFTLATPVPGPLLLMPGHTVELLIEFDTQSSSEENATLNVTDSNDQTVSIILSSDGIFADRFEAEE